ncbi:hypothetical protein [Algiphilus aromaticivorans]|uniref:hypothetical protein n=1 Tax=Algiphilus aromaticivorans TaxID=382454 RepID=UPI000693C9D5|nr:hypothetical protein [Algiphilus aromaticivorans]
MADDGNTPDGAHQALTRVHWQRLRRMYRSAGWPYLDPVELDLLAAGLLQRSEGADTVHLTEAGIEALAQQRKSNQNAFGGHAALIERMGQQLMVGGRLCFSELSLRARLESGWNRVRPDLFSIRRTSREDRLAPEVHEIKVRRSDLLSELRATEKRAAYEALSARCYFVLAAGVGEANEVPEPWGVWIEKEGALCLAREAAQRNTGLDFSTWMGLARATPFKGDDEGEQQSF